MTTNNLEYEIILDIKLEHIEDAVNFLNKSNSDIGWTVDGMLRKLGNDNPAGRGYLALAVFNNLVVGTASLTKKIILVNGNKVSAAEVGDTYTDPIYRKKLKANTYYHLDSNPKSYVNKSMFGRLLSEVRDAAKDDGVQVIYGTPNANSYPGYTKYLGFVATENYHINSYCKYKISFFWKKIAKIFAINLNSNTCNEKKIEVSINKFEYNNFIEKIFNINYDFILYKNYDYIKYRYLNDKNYKIEKFYINKKLSCLIIYKIKKINEINYIFIAEIIYDNLEAANRCIKNISKIKNIDAVIFWTDQKTFKKLKLYINLFFKRSYLPIIIYKNTDLNNKIIKSSNINFGMGCTDNV